VAPYIARWNGATWQPLGSGLNGSVLALIAYRDGLIAGGNFSIAGGVPANHIALWNGLDWQPLGTGLNGIVLALAIYNDELVAAGNFTMAGEVGQNRIARWNGTDWLPLGSGTNNVVNAITVFDDELIAAGYFTTAGDVNARHIASWNGTGWRPLGLESNWVPDALAVHDGYLIAAGQIGYSYFRIPYWARWGTPRPIITGQPIAQPVHPGRGVSFSVDASGAKPLAYQWRKDGVALADNNHISGANTAALTIHKARPSDAGQYDVVVSNMCGVAVSEPATLSVATQGHVFEGE
jgi:hypothetical protein